MYTASNSLTNYAVHAEMLAT